MIKREEFSTFMFHMRKAIPTFAPDIDDNETVGIWFAAFNHCEMNDLRKIYAYVRDNEKTFPSIARMKELLKTESASRFDDLVGLIAKHGAYRPPVVDDLMAMTINRLGGWQKVCDWTDTDLPFRKKEFDLIYGELTQQRKIGHLPPADNLALKGIHDTAPVASSPAKLQIAERVEERPAVKESVDWDAVKAIHWDFEECESEKLRDKGFFKLKSNPMCLFRYCHGAKPGKGWPHSFVDVDVHMNNMRSSKPKVDPFDPNRFDASRYGVDNFKD